MELMPAVISGCGAALFSRGNGGFPEYCVSGGSMPVKMEFLPGKINGVPEKSSLAEYRRTHVALDGLSGGYELSNRIPFGPEYRFKRTIEMGSGWGTVVCDAAVIGPGNIQSLELAEIVLTGNWAKCLFVKISGEVESIDITGGMPFTSPVPWRAVVLENTAGDRFEIGTGDDWWRWVPEEDANAEFTLEITPEKADFRRKLFDFPVQEEDADAPPVRRKTWRCQWYWAWTPAKMPVCSTAVSAMEDIPDDCCKSPAFQRAFRNSIRKYTAKDRVISCKRTSDRFCPDAAHLERPGKKELFHFDRCEALKTFLWANKRIIASGGKGFIWDSGNGEKISPAEVRMMYPAETGFTSPARELEEQG